MKKIKYITLILSVVCGLALIADLATGKSVWWNTGFDIIPSVNLSSVKSGTGNWKSYGYPTSDATALQTIAKEAQTTVAYNGKSNSDRDYAQSQTAGLNEATLVNHSNLIAENETGQQVVIAVGGLVAKTAQTVALNDAPFSANSQRFMTQTMNTELTHPGGAPIGKPIDNVPIGSEHCLYFIIFIYCILRYKKHLLTIFYPHVKIHTESLNKQFGYIKENYYLCGIKKNVERFGLLATTEKNAK